jgi:hypothetical protein
LLVHGLSTKRAIEGSCWIGGQDPYEH